MAIKSNIILMADIIDSRQKQPQQLMNNFQAIVEYINHQEKKNIYSPLTITLGDEFQGVIKDLKSALNIILQIEEKIVSMESGFKLRYVLLEGAIETKLNKKVAYGMLGSGLTSAREYLIKLKENKGRFYFDLANKKQANALNNTFLILQKLIDSWDIERDYYIVSEFLKDKDYKKVAMILNKERSLIWKREKTLRLDEYYATKDIIKYIGDQLNE